MSDHILRAITSDGLVQAAAISSRDLTERARQIHKTLPVATAALGRTLAGASMMGNALKGHGASLTLQIKGSGPLGTILAVSDSDGNVRGYVTNPQTELPLRPDGKLDVGGAVGQEGSLTVIKDLHMKEPYVGTVNLLGGEIAEDIAAYFVESEQIPTACALGVLIDRNQSVKAAGGYLIQLMPGGDHVLTASNMEPGDRLNFTVEYASWPSTLYWENSRDNLPDNSRGDDSYDDSDDSDNWVFTVFVIFVLVIFFVVRAAVYDGYAGGFGTRYVFVHGLWYPAGPDGRHPRPGSVGTKHKPAPPRSSGFGGGKRGGGFGGGGFGGGGSHCACWRR